MRLTIAAASGIAGDISDQLLETGIDLSCIQYRAGQCRELAEKFWPVRHGVKAGWHKPHTRFHGLK